MTTSRTRRGTKPWTIIVEIEMALPEFSALSSKAESVNTSVAALVLRAYDHALSQVIIRKKPSAPRRKVKTSDSRRKAIRKGLAKKHSASKIAASLGMTSAGVYYHINAIAREDAAANAAAEGASETLQAA